MPWTISTYAGTYMGGSPSNARVALFELMRGVNERQAALLITKTLFYKADGSQAADLSMADILNIRASGVESNVEKNLKRVRDSIISMVDGGSFTEASTGGVAWTKASLEAAIGTDLDAGPIRPQEARYWQAMQDGLDRLIYGLRVILPDDDVGIDSAGTEGGTFAAIDDAWDDRHTYVDFGLLPYTAYWSVAPGFGSGYSVKILTGRVLNFSVPDYSGVPTGCAYYISNYDNPSAIIVNYSVGGFDGSMGAGASAGGGEWKESASADLALNADNNILAEITTPDPIICPFSDEAITFISLGRARVYIDISGELADQA